MHDILILSLLDNMYVGTKRGKLTLTVSTWEFPEKPWHFPIIILGLPGYSQLLLVRVRCTKLAKICNATTLRGKESYFKILWC